jgi:endonuclease/exonuclease/phosphatase (EEP) superfamily protein YafD
VNLALILQPFARLFLVGGSLTVIASILASFGHLSWYLDLLSHFRVQYFFLLLVASTFFILYRRLWIALLFITVCLANLIPVVPLHLKPPSPEGEYGGKIRIMLINVNTQQGNPDKVLQIVSKLNPDILVLQEISEQWVEQLAGLKDHYPENIIDPRDDNFGIGLFSKFHLQSSDILTIGSADIPSITAQLVTPFGKISILAAHPLPPVGKEYWEHRNNQLEALVGHATQNECTILIGDLNTTPWNHFLNASSDSPVSPIVHRDMKYNPPGQVQTPSYGYH